LRDIGHRSYASNARTAADIGGTFERASLRQNETGTDAKTLKNDINSNCYLFKDTYVVSSALATSGSTVRWFRDEIRSLRQKTPGKYLRPDVCAFEI